jgi:hypothetical protein
MPYMGPPVDAYRALCRRARDRAVEPESVRPQVVLEHHVVAAAEEKPRNSSMRRNGVERGRHPSKGREAMIERITRPIERPFRSS